MRVTAVYNYHYHDRLLVHFDKADSPSHSLVSYTVSRQFVYDPATPGFFPPSFHLSQSCINFPLCTHLFTPLRGSSIHRSIALFPLVHHRPLTPPHPPSLFLTLILYKSSPLIASKTFFHLSFSLILYHDRIENGSHCIQSVVFMKMTAWFFRLSNVKNGRHDSRG
jgi:hypothetical protein